MSDVDESMCEDNAGDEPVFLNEIAKPVANPKLTKRLLKLIKKSSTKKDKLTRGLKNVQTRIRKGDTGLCIFAGDVTPIDVYCHMPIVCEEKNIPYCFVTSKRSISACLGAKRPCIVALIKPDDEYKDLFKKCYDKVSKLS